MGNDQFNKWACGCSGMDGGNPNGDLWFCGIEYGGASNEHDFADLKKEIASFTGETIPSATAEMRSTTNFNHQLNQKIAKVACRYYAKGKDPMAFLREELCDIESSSGVFKMNLYPINFRSVDSTQWSDQHRLITGFSDKLQYKAWCIKNRFPALNRLVQRFSPKVLICFGLNHYLDFLLAFDGAIPVDMQEVTLEAEPVKTARYTWINNNSTLFLVVPFLGQGGLMSDISLHALADFARNALPRVG